MTVGVLKMFLILLCSLAADLHPEPVLKERYITPENLGRICDSRIRRYLEGPVARSYELTPAQKERFRARLLELKQAQIGDTLSTLEERKRAVEAAHPHYMTRSQTTQSSPEFLEHYARVRAFNDKNPLFREDNVLEELEKMLPATQARAGRERYRRAQDDAVAVESRRWRVEGFLESGQLRGSFGVRLLIEPDDGWERFVRKFCALYQLQDDQVATVQTISRELFARRDEYRMRHEAEIEAAFSTGAPSHPGLFRPIDEIWEQLRARLDAIPTSDQIASMKAAKVHWATTRPTDYLVPPTATRPAGNLASQPAPSGEQ